ncbi:hypothetical protein CEP52_006409 [Fusarium oligoseptatum]|uniref:Uncharacterized protein n=1 Tax=Fusarium oligoseptatum TaxID=2604345 RepID=A0A428TT80_9HYPO|nr:hypothetical protein CEP52_006409 [Fusarium oligoseptatum]
MPTVHIHPTTKFPLNNASCRGHRNRAALRLTIRIFKSPLPTPVIFSPQQSLQAIMSGVEVAVPIVLFCAGLFKEAFVGVLETNADAQAFLMLERNVANDIVDAQTFLSKLERYVGQEEDLKVAVRISIRETKEAMEKFHERLEDVEKRKLKWIVRNRKFARSLLDPLQSAQSALSKRVDRMRDALETLANSPKEEKGELPSSMSLQVPTMVRQ